MVRRGRSKVENSSLGSVRLRRRKNVKVCLRLTLWADVCSVGHSGLWGTSSFETMFHHVPWCSQPIFTSFWVSSFVFFAASSVFFTSAGGSCIKVNSLGWVQFANIHIKLAVNTCLIINDLDRHTLLVLISKRAQPNDRKFLYQDKLQISNWHLTHSLADLFKFKSDDLHKIPIYKIQTFLPNL